MGFQHSRSPPPETLMRAEMNRSSVFGSLAVALCMVACGDMDGAEKTEGPAPETEQKGLHGSCLTNADCGNSCLKCVGGIPDQQYGYCTEITGKYAYSTSTSCVVESFFCTTQPPV